MLRKLTLNRKVIPIPVPLQTLGEAVQWIGDTLLLPGHSITRLTVNGVDYDFATDTSKIPLKNSDLLDVKVDSPIDLSVQTLEALSNLASIVLRGVKPLAVVAWEASGQKPPDTLPTIHEDLELIGQLLENFWGLSLPSRIETANLKNLTNDQNRITASLSLAKGNSDWRGYAKIMLNRLEPLLQDLIGECECLEAVILELKSTTPFGVAL